MLALSEIEKSYPENLRGFRRFMLREYLQHKILQIIYDSEFANELCFLGGTCLRIVHGNARFSEDLDFDNFKIGEIEFKQLSKILQYQLAQEGYELEIKTVYRGAYHCYIRFPEILFKEGLSGYREEKILIQLDTEPQHFDYTPEKYILNRFDTFTQILTTPLDLLLAQKFYAICNRPKNKGRDFFDSVFLLSLVKRPNYDYLQFKMGVNNESSLKERILHKCSTLNMDEMAKDVQPFLFNHSEIKKVLLFTELIQQVKL